MTLTSKRVIFWTLCLLFAGYTLAVDTKGTVKDKGEQFLTEDAKKGKLLFQKHNCTACHQLFGLGGYMGPDLTNVISQEGKGAAYAEAFLISGTARMPDFKLTEAERKQLVSYLEYVDKAGTSPVYNAKINPDGSIELPGEE